MKLVKYDTKSVTIELDRSEEFSVILGMARILDLNYEYLDEEQISMRRKDVSRVTEDIFDLANEVKP